MVSLSVIPFVRDGLPVFGALGGDGGRTPRPRHPTSYRTALHRSPFPNRVFFYFRTNSHSLLTQEKSPLDGAARHFVERDAQNHDVRPERARLRHASGSARKPLTEQL